MQVTFSVTPAEINDRIIRDELIDLFGDNRLDETECAASRALPDDTFRFSWTLQSVSRQGVMDVLSKIQTINEILDKTDATVTATEDMEDVVGGLLALGLALDRLKTRVRDAEAEQRDIDLNTFTNTELGVPYA